MKPLADSAVGDLKLIHPRKAGRGNPLLNTSIWVALAVALGIRGSELGAHLFPMHASHLSPDDAVAVLSSVSSGMIAFTGIVFSLATVALQYATSSYSPRVIGELGQARITSHALGVFTGTFLYSLLAIGAVNRAGTSSLNSLVVVTAMLWLSASIVLFITLLPRFAGMSESRILARLGEAGRDATSRLYTPRPGRPTTPFESDTPVRQSVTHRGGPRYLVGFDVPRLSAEAAQCGGVVEILHPIGAAILPGATLLRVRGAATASEDRLRAALWLELSGATVNDPAYALRLLVDIAIRALSPAINDPTTAVDALQQIQPILRQLGAAEIPPQRIVYEGDTPRVVFPCIGWDALVDLALGEIRQYGADSQPVRRRLRELGEALRAELPPGHHAALQRFCD